MIVPAEHGSMIALGWLLAAVAVVLLRLPSRALGRAAALAAAGRLAAPDAVGRQSVATSTGVPDRRDRLLDATMSAAGVTACASVVVTAGPALAVTCGLVWWALWSRVCAARRARRAARIRAALAQAVRLLVTELEAGGRPAAALAAAGGVGPLRAAFDDAAHAVERGELPDWPHTVDGVDDPVVVTGCVGLAHAWRVADACGAPLAGVLGRVADDLDTAERRRATVGTVLAGPRSSASLLAALPMVGLVLGTFMGARPVPLLLGSPTGHLLCLVGVALNLGGLRWTAALAARAERPAPAS